MAWGKSFFGGGGSKGGIFWVDGCIVGGKKNCVACFFPSFFLVEVQQVDLRALNILGCTKYHTGCLRPCKQILLLL